MNPLPLLMMKSGDLYKAGNLLHLTSTGVQLLCRHRGDGWDGEGCLGGGGWGWGTALAPVSTDALTAVTTSLLCSRWLGRRTGAWLAEAAHP